MATAAIDTSSTHPTVFLAQCMLSAAVQAGAGRKVSAGIATALYHAAVGSRGRWSGIDPEVQDRLSALVEPFEAMAVAARANPAVRSSSGLVGPAVHVLGTAAKHEWSRSFNTITPAVARQCQRGTMGKTGPRVRQVLPITPWNEIWQCDFEFTSISSCQDISEPVRSDDGSNIVAHGQPNAGSVLAVSADKTGRGSTTDQPCPVVSFVADPEPASSDAAEAISESVRSNGGSNIVARVQPNVWSVSTDNAGTTGSENGINKPSPVVSVMADPEHVCLTSESESRVGMIASGLGKDSALLESRARDAAGGLGKGSGTMQPPMVHRARSLPAVRRDTSGVAATRAASCDGNWRVVGASCTARRGLPQRAAPLPPRLLLSNRFGDGEGPSPNDCCGESSVATVHAPVDEERVVKQHPHITIHLSNSDGDSSFPIVALLDTKVDAFKDLIAKTTGMRRHGIALTSDRGVLDRNLCLRNYGLVDGDCLTLTFRAPVKHKGKPAKGRR